jgi:hypothetical protein
MYQRYLSSSGRRDLGGFWSSGGLLFCDVSVSCTSNWLSDLEVSGFDVLFELVQSGALWHRLPSWETTFEDFVHFFQGLSLGLGCCQEHMDEGCAIEGGEDHVHLPVDCSRFVSRDGDNESDSTYC